MAGWVYHRPSSLREAANLLLRYGAGARLLAGGTDLLVQMKEKKVQVDHVISLRGVDGGGTISDTGLGGLSIGAKVTVGALEESTLINSRLPGLAQAASLIGSRQVRNLGTLGGNLCNAAPSADLAPILIAMESVVVIYTLSGERRLPLEDFFLGPSLTVLGPGELMLGVEVPLPGQSSAAGYQKHSIRKAVDIALVGVAAALTMGPAGLEKVRLVLGAVAPKPVRAVEAESILTGSGLSDREIEAAASAAARECNPITDLRASEGYRREMVRVLTARLLSQLRKKFA